MGNGNTDSDSQNNCGSESTSEPSPPPKYTRFSTTTFVYPLYPSHAAHPSTSSTTSSSNTVAGCGPTSMSSSSCSTSTARPSFESFTTPSDHGFSQARGQQEQKEYHIAQYSSGAFQVCTSVPCTYALFPRRLVPSHCSRPFILPRVPGTKVSRHSFISRLMPKVKFQTDPSLTSPQVQQRHPSSSSPERQDELDNAPPYESSFRDTNLSGLPAEALSALSLARENLSDLQRASFFAGYNLDDLDRSDDRADPDSIIQRRLTRNALLSRQSAITLASASSGSVYSEPGAIVSAGNETRTSSLLVPQAQQRDSVYSTATATTNDYEYDPLRVSVQTYGSSVLTYGSRASQLIDGDHGNYNNNNSSIAGNWNEGGSGNGSDGGRPVAPLPWLPRPSALDRIQHCGIHLSTRTRSGSVGSNSGSGSGRRPLPPLPTPISATGNKPSLQTLTRDRSASLPSRSISLDSNSSASTGTVGGPRRAPRPLPRTPSAAIATSSNLPDILEGQASDVTNSSVTIGGSGIAPSSGPVRSNSMFLSPTSVVSTSPLNLRGRRSSSARYSTIGYGHAARVGMRGVFSRGNDSEAFGAGLNEMDEAGAGRNAGAQKPYGRTASRASTRSARSTFLIPDVDELVRILDSMDDSPGSTNSASGSGSSSESCLTTPLPGSVPGPVLGLWGRRISNAFAFGRKSVIGAGKDEKGDEGIEVEDGEEEIDMGEALACSRSVVTVPCGERRGAAAALEDLGINIGVGVGLGIGVTAKNSSSTGTIGIGLPTPAATPRNSPHRQPASLPGSSKNSANAASATPPPPPPPKPTHPLPQSSHARNQLPPPPTSSIAQSPALSPSDTDALSLTSFPLPPVAPLFIPAPSAVGAAEMPIPSASSTGVPPSPSLLDVGKSPAERAVLPGMSMTTTTAKKDEVTLTHHPKHITAREAIADLKHRVAELPKFTFPASVRSKGIVKMFPSGVPLLGFPVPPRRRAQSTSTSASTYNARNNRESGTKMAKKHAFPIPPAIDVHAANALPPPTSFNGLGRVTPGSSSAPPNNQTFELDKPTIIYATPELAPAPALAQLPVAPLKIRSTSSRRMEVVNANGRVPMTVPQPQSAEAVKTSFNITACSGKQGKSSGRAQRATSFCVSPSSSDSPGGVAPLRFKTSKAVSRARSSTIGAVATPSILLSTKQQLQKKDQDKENIAPAVDHRKSSETDGSEESESDHLVTPTATNAPLPSVVEARTSDENENEARGHQHHTISSTAGAFSILSSNTNNTSTSFSILHQPTSGAQTHISIDPTFADLIKSMAGASEEEQMGSLLTIASSINTEHHASGYNAGFFVPLVDESRTREDDGFVDIDDEDVNMNGMGYGNASPNEGALRRQESVRKSIASGISATGSITERRKSKTRSISSLKKRHSARSAAALRAAIRALPDPNTFPLPTPDSGGSVATDLSAQAAGADYHRFGLRPSPLPKLRVVTKFKGGTVLLPATCAPLSATSTKSTMSAFGAGGHSRNTSAVSVVSAKRSSTTTGMRKMNRLTLTDPRSPMGEAAIAAATLVARVRQKRAALAASRNRPLAGAAFVNSSGNNNIQCPTVVHVMTRGHTRTGSGSSATQTLKSKLKMSGGSFFGGSTLRTQHNSSGRAAIPAASDKNVGNTPTPIDDVVRIDAGIKADADVVVRSGPRAQRPTIRRVRRARTSVVPAKSIELDLDA
ncbi:hypothetical protein A7U60_g4008 [Sanghuangporus baumii]|uniref:Uncharacterized protein n=1 Tax=Sanghuangporus baumii TaxID=108892 RepID=A0A9Q5HZQ8_SANBA|nr:hypothetical protein A7U60_g4008 [Sanghuangporus baumii]